MHKSSSVDKVKAAGSYIEAIDHATLVDSMLLNWRLPVARSQEAFDYWREKRRDPTWRRIDADLKRHGIDPHAIDGEHVVFSVRVAGSELLIHPIHVLDLSRAGLVADQQPGVTEVLDGWDERARA